MTPRCRCRPPRPWPTPASSRTRSRRSRGPRRVLREFEFTGRRDGDRAELDGRARDRGDLYALLTASRDDAVAIVNEMLADAGAVPQLVRHDEWDWHLHAVGARARPADPDRGRGRDGDDRRDPRRRDVPARRLRRRRPAAASSSTCPATARSGSARPPAATATRSRPTGPAGAVRACRQRTSSDAAVRRSGRDRARPWTSGNVSPGLGSELILVLVTPPVEHEHEPPGADLVDDPLGVDRR